jgi:hypothetical protein
MVAEFKGATSGNVIDATKARAHLPGLEIEIVHRGRRRASRTVRPSLTRFVFCEPKPLDGPQKLSTSATGINRTLSASMKAQ